MLGRWDNASKIKVENRIMRKNSSWIEIRNKVYEFVSDQKPSDEVSDKLPEMEEKMKELGYVVKRNRLMPTIEEEEYGGEGFHHSEMKAVALGLILLPHGMPIRVMKSVRMCGHCHHACKLMSTFIDRVSCQGSQQFSPLHLWQVQLQRYLVTYFNCIFAALFCANTKI